MDNLIKELRRQFNLWWMSREDNKENEFNR